MKGLRLLLFACSFCISIICSAQSSYKPTNKWPYIFEKFTPVVIHHLTTNGTSNVEANICVDDGSLHFLDDGTILQLRTGSIAKVEFGERIFIPINNYLMEVLVDTPDGMIVKSQTIKAGEDGVDIGFGMTSSTNAASNFDLTATLAFGTSLLHSKIAEAAIEAAYGSYLDVETKIYFFVNGYLIPATKKDFTETVGKDVANAFLKENKIKWNEPASMLPAIKLLKEKK
ncbi:MAG: hypothetical protein MJZ16_02960 [Bacteroidales bacterium]|nr:hypothetical protein [Bacteroidales bacterium]